MFITGSICVYEISTGLRQCVTTNMVSNFSETLKEDVSCKNSLKTICPKTYLIYT